MPTITYFCMVIFKWERSAKNDKIIIQLFCFIKEIRLLWIVLAGLFIMHGADYFQCLFTEFMNVMGVWHENFYRGLCDGTFMAIKKTYKTMMLSINIKIPRFHLLKKIMLIVFIGSMSGCHTIANETTYQKVILFLILIKLKNILLAVKVSVQQCY